MLSSQPTTNINSSYPLTIIHVAVFLPATGCRRVSTVLHSISETGLTSHRKVQETQQEFSPEIRPFKPQNSDTSSIEEADSWLVE